MMDNNEKIEYIVTHYTKLMHTAANSILNDYHESEDACQEAFLKLYRVVDKLEDVQSIRTRAYCITTARNTAVDMARKKAKQIPCEEIPKDSMNDDIAKTSTAEAEEMFQDIDALPEKYQNIIRLRCFEDRSAEETAEMLNSSVSTVNSQLLRARAMLKNKWVSIACLLFGITILAAGTLASGVLKPEVNYSSVYSAKESSDDAALNGYGSEEVFDVPASGTDLSESELYRELDRFALKEVEGASETDIIERELLEENETEFLYKVTVLYKGQTHMIRMKINGEIISHEIN